MLKCVFFGTPYFAAEVLKHLLEVHCCEIVGVVTRLDQPKGRSRTPIPSPVKLVAQEHQLPLWQAPRTHTPESLAWLESCKADLFIVVAFGEIVKQVVLDLPPLGCINIHASLLPAYRGAAPMQWSLIHGVPITGISIQQMVLACDAGDVLCERRVAVDPEWTCADLQEALLALTKPALCDTLRSIEQGQIQPKPQDETLVTWAPKIELEQSQLHFERSATTLHNLIRGVSPEPGAWCWKLSPGKEQRFRILRSTLPKEQPILPQMTPGEGIVHQGRLYVQCGEGVLELLEVQLEGKAIMPVRDFLNGLQTSRLLLGGHF